MFDTDPKTWKDLQNMVAQTFYEMDCEAETEKSITTVRGGVNVDVFVTDNNHVPPIVCLCECKHWSHRVPKTVVHAFRTVVADYGANLGMIISRRGFQVGSHEAVGKSNVVLLSWGEFVRMYEARWTESRCKCLKQMLEILRQYRNSPEIVEKFPSKERWTEEFEYAWLDCIRECDKVWVTCSGSLPKMESGQFPLEFMDLESYDGIKMKRHTINSKRDYLNYFLPRLLKFLRRYQELGGALRGIANADWTPRI